MNQESRDEQLMAQFQQGDEDAFKILFDRYANHVINFAYRLIGSRAESEDIAQDVFLRIFRKKERFDLSKAFRPWLFTIAARLISNRLRDQKRRFHPSLDFSQDGETWDPPDSRLGPSDQYEQEELIHVIWEALQSLPENQRMALILCRFEDMSQDDIAVVLNTTLPSVKSLLFRARQSLRQKLGSYILDSQAQVSNPFSFPQNN